MNRIEDASAGLALIMRGAQAQLWEAFSDGQFVVHVSVWGRGSPTAPHLVTVAQVSRAEEFLARGVPPLRGELDPTPLAWRQGPQRRSSGKRRDGRR